MDSSPRGLLLVGLLVLPRTWAGPGSHTLMYIHTGWTRPELGEPRFVSAGYVDGVEFVRFDSDAPTPRMEPRTAWVKGVIQEDPEYWERTTWIGRTNARVYRERLEALQRNHNRSEGGVYTIQYLHRCEVSPDGRFQRGLSQHAYNGQDYNSPDAKTWTCVVPSQETISKRKVEGGSEAESHKAYLEEECVQWLHQYLEMGKEALTRTDPPSARVTHHAAPDGEMTLRCRAQDFYPAEISLTWLRDGAELLQDTEFIETRPGGDGTFQKWAAVGVTPGQEGSYTCRIQHEGLAEPLTLKWEPPPSSTWSILGAIAGAMFLLSAVLAGVLIWKKKENPGGKRGAYVQAANNDSAQGSDDSLIAKGRVSTI
ncbi:class I histocompatibility antigen, Gogo-OKO alpha chain-like [Macrotis lagotis]|uniref:class I histocompatibility antigen, Gogo-OKO alpha chain-like n=1 Tax=Macrotis lagotis TaxID=92651 RepID=UPI003D68EAFF